MFAIVRRPWRRLFLLGLIFFVSALWAQQPQQTTVRDVVYRADGTTAQGALLISWPGFTLPNGQAVAGGTTSTRLGPDGTLSVALIPNANANPSNTVYTVVYQLNDDSVRTEYWSVPTNSPATLAQVRVALGTTGSAAQMATQQFVQTSLAEKANDSAVVHLSGAEVISGLKQFSVSPSLPTPVQPGDAANKQYVDNSVQNVGSGSYLSLAGGTMQGPLTLSSDPNSPNQAANKHYVDTSVASKADLIAGLVPPAELATGTPGANTCLLGNQTWGPCPAGGGGSSYINSTLVANPNFNAMTPAAQSKFLNCTFQNSASNVSLECPYGNSAASFALGSQAVLNNQSNTYGNGLQDFTSASLKLPSGAGYTPSTPGAIGFDSTANMPVINVNGLTQQLALTTSNISGQASTALALATTPAQCNGSFATGIQANGNANCGVADVIQLSETSAPQGIPNYGLFWFDAGTHTPRVIDNNGQVVQLALTNVFNTDANTLEEYNGTTPQTLNVYGTRMDTADYERLRLGYDTADGYFFVGSDAGGSGNQRGLGFWLSGSLRWAIDSSFNLKPWSDNLKDIGAATLRVRNLYLGTGLVFGSGTLTGVHGTTGTALEAGTVGTTAGAPFCNDGNGNATDAGCPTGAVGSVFGRTGIVTAQAGDYSVAQVTGAAPLNSPALTGIPTAPTPPSSDNSTAIATTAWVKTQGYGIGTGGVPNNMTPGGRIVAATSSTIASTSGSLDASQMNGTDAFAKMNSCITALPAGGGKCDGGNLTSGTVSTNLTISKSNVQVDWGAAGFTMGSTTTITISGSNVEFNCVRGAAGTVFSSTTNTGSGTAGTPLGSVVTITGQNVRFRGCAIQGNRLASNDNFSGAACISASGANGLLLEENNLTNCGAYGISADKTSNATIQRNYIAQTAGPGIQLNASGGGPYYADTIQNNWLYDTDTSAGGGVATGAYELNVIASGGVGLLQKVRVLNNVVANDVVGGDGTSNASVCTGNGTSAATGCLGGIQLTSNVFDYEVSGNIVRNTTNEGIAVGSWRGDVHDNDISLAHVNASGVPVDNGSGCILYYIGPGVPTQGDSKIHDNRCSDSGYLFKLVLGNNVATNGTLVENIDVHDNHAVNINHTMLAGIRILNENTSGCSGTQCTWTISNLTFSNNEVNAATTPWEFDTPGLTYTNGVAAFGPNGFLGNSPVAQVPLQSVAGFVSGTGSTPNVALLNSPLFTGSPTAPTPAFGDSSTKLATTAYVQAQTTSLPWFTQPFSNGNGITLSSTANKAYLYGVTLAYPVTTSQVTYYVVTQDSSANTYDIGIYQGASGSSDSLVAHIGATAGTAFSPSTGWKTLNWTSPVTLQPGRYYLAITSSCTSSCAQIGSGSTNTGFTFDYNNSLGVTSGGTLPSSITGPADNYAVASIPVWAVH